MSAKYSFRIRYRPRKGAPVQEERDSILCPDRGEANYWMNQRIYELRTKHGGRWTGFLITKAETHEVQP